MPKTDPSRLRPSTLASNPRASLSAYLRFRDTIEAAISSHPAAHVCVPQDYAPATFVSRIRDAVRGLIAFDYPCAHPPERISLWWSEVVVAFDPHDPNAVIIGPKTSVVEKINAPKAVPQDMKAFVSLEPDEFSAFCLLISRGRIDGPVHVKNHTNSSVAVPANVEIISRPDGSIVLI